jgi:hypothetical protein
MNANLTTTYMLISILTWDLHFKHLVFVVRLYNHKSHLHLLAYCYIVEYIGAVHHVVQPLVLDGDQSLSIITSLYK